MLEANRKKLEKLTGLEIYCFIIGRTLIGLAVGIWLGTRITVVAHTMFWPSLLIGLVTLVVAFRGYFRR